MKLWQAMLMETMGGGWVQAQSYLLDGASGKAAGNCTVANYANQGSLSVWVLADATMTNAAYVNLWAVDAGAYVTLYRSGASLYFRGQVTLPGPVGKYTDPSLTKIATSPFTVWHHLAMTWTKDGNVLGYLDGASVGAGQSLGGVAMRTTGHALAIGPPPTDGPASYPRGNVDELSAWTVALTPAQVAELRPGGLPGDLSAHSAAANLAGWWRADGDTLPTITDHSAAAITGTATAGVSQSAAIPS